MLRSLSEKRLVNMSIEILGYFKDDAAALSRHVLGAEPDRFTKKTFFVFTSQRFKM